MPKLPDKEHTVSQWSYWMIAAAAVFVLELFVGTVYLLVLAAALAGTSLSVLLFGIPLSAALVVAAALSGAGVYAVHRNRSAHKPADSNDLDIGQPVSVEAVLPNGHWRVFYRGAPWEAKNTGSAELQAGGSAEICGKEGIVLLVRKR